MANVQENHETLAGESKAFPIDTSSFYSDGTTPVSPALVGLLAAQRATRAAWEAYRDAEYTPMEEASMAARALLPIEYTQATYTSIVGPGQRYSTEPWKVAMARVAIEDAAYMDAEHLAAARECIALSERREGQLAAINIRFWVDEIEARHNELMDADLAACKAIFGYPVLHVADVLAKLAFIASDDAWDFDEAQEGLVADLHRLNVHAEVSQ